MPNGARAFSCSETKRSARSPPNITQHRDRDFAGTRSTDTESRADRDIAPATWRHNDHSAAGQPAAPLPVDRSTHGATSRIVVIGNQRLVGLIHVPVNVALVMIQNQYRPVFAVALAL